MKNVFQGLLVLLCIVLPDAAVLRAGRTGSARRQDPTTTAASDADAVTTTTTNAIIGAILEVEQHLNKTVYRYDQQLSSINSSLLDINRTLTGWNFNIEVLNNGSEADNATIKNNTELLEKVNQSSNFDLVTAKIVGYEWAYGNNTVKESKLTMELTGKNASEANATAATTADPGATTTAPAAADPEDADLESRVSKVKSAYYLNGSKINNMVADLDSVERMLAVNSSLVVERILRRSTDDALAEIPKEMSRQLDEAMNPTPAPTPAPNGTNGTNGTNATNGSFLIHSWQVLHPPKVDRRYIMLQRHK